jgi:hypothetical protein
MKDFSEDGLETYSPVVDSATTTKILFAIEAYKGWSVNSTG